ncbi:MAG TPA: signal peptide peptidase SppA [Chitinophagaceae bacterium]|nr:signal peptide peptidase SppA [Chitinophagaceae bacterium]
MKTFFKIFFASFLALIVFTVIGVIILLYIIGNAGPGRPVTGAKGVLVVDLGTTFNEQAKDNPLYEFTGDVDGNVPGLYDVVRMLHYAKTDSSIKGVLIKPGYNMNGFATSEELRQAIVDFKQSRKFVIAYGDVFSQKDYYVATAANNIYCNPQGGIDWSGYNAQLYFLKGLLDNLGIEPEIFYAGKFKSATEPFRVTQMTDANRLQTTVWLNDLYNNLLLQTSAARNIDTSQLHLWANTGAIQTANDALSHHLADGLKYDDEMNKTLQNLTGADGEDDINFVSLAKYAKSVDFKQDGDDKIAIIYAQGDIVNGEGKNEEEIGSDTFIKLIRKARLDKSTKAIVFRVNSPGGSSLASDEIWREITLAKKVKPVVISMGDYAASGGYYISCNGDSIFADRGTITGSIGVFSMMFNMQQFFKNKLGVTFDGVKTAPYADLGSVARPLTEQEKKFVQAGVDTIYATFKNRVADGRKKDVNYIDSIAQGHVWTGQRAVGLGLVDRTGTLQDAVECAARMAKTKSYYVKEYPEAKFSLQQLLRRAFTGSVQENVIKQQVGGQQYRLMVQARKLQQLMGVPQARLPFDYSIQ